MSSPPAQVVELRPTTTHWSIWPACASEISLALVEGVAVGDYVIVMSAMH